MRRERLRQVVLQDGQLVLFAFGQIFAPTLAVLRDGIAALLHHPVQHVQDEIVIRLAPVVDLALLDLRPHQAEVTVLGQFDITLRNMLRRVS